MSDNALKTPLYESLNRFAEAKIADAIEILGKGLPCSVVSVSGSIITVKFEIVSGFTLPQVSIPLFGPEYIRYPIQAGCKGVVLPMSADIAAICGLSSGTSDLSQPANLSALVFMPVANVGWSSVDGNVLTLYGPNGVTMRDTSNSASIEITTSGITLTFGSKVVTLNSSGLTIDGILFDTHAHLYTPGGGTPTDTGGPV